MMVEKDGRREGDKGTVSSSDTCFSVYHLYRAARSKVSNFPFLGLSSLLSVTTGRRLLRGCYIPWELYIYIS